MKNLLLTLCLLPFIATAQEKLLWQNADSLYGPLPPSVHVFYTVNPIDTAPFQAFYLIADLKDKGLNFATDTTYKRRLTPSKFYERNGQPLVVVNGTFFSFETNGNLNVVVKNKKLLAYNMHTIPGRGKDTLTYRHPFPSAIGISKKRRADVAWLYTDSATRKIYAFQVSQYPLKDSFTAVNYKYVRSKTDEAIGHKGKVQSVRRWKMQTAIGGGPVLIQNGSIAITNNEELKFAGKAINDKHPRTAMGYTADGKLIILVVEGRNNGIAHGATLTQEAQILKDLGCVEALNLDGGGSSCLLVNGRETIKPSDKGVQRAVPAVFLIKQN
jgi:hypothetical protein